MVTKTVAITSGTSWTIPSDAYGQSATIICIGAGATGGSIIGLCEGGNGGTSGCIAQITSYTLPSSGSVTVQIPAGNSASACWFNSSATVQASSKTTSTAACVGSTVFGGNLGGTSICSCTGVSPGGGGGGAPGISTQGSAGANGVLGVPAAGGAAGTPTYTLTAGGTAGPGAGGASSGSVGVASSPGNNYGAGGGGTNDSSGSPGAGAPGVIVVIYTSSTQTGAPNQDYPNPQGYQRSIDLLFWTNPNAVINTLLNVTYAVPGHLTEQPLPNRGAYFNRDILNYTDPIDLNLLGQDKMIRGAGFGVQNYDWPVPKGKEYPSSLRTYVYSLNCWYSSQTMYYTPGMGVPQLSWPVPPGYIQPIANKTWVYNQTINQYNLIVALLGFGGPHRQTDWPVPKGYVPNIDLRTTDWNGTLLELLSTTMFGNAGQVAPLRDWPVPPGYIQPIVNKTWVYNNTLDLEQVIILNPHKNMDWPVPKGYIPEASLKTYVTSMNFPLTYNYIINHRNPYSFSIIMG